MNYENILYTLALKAFKKDEVPISAIIVKDNKIISKAYNKRQKTKNVLDHAEIIAIKKASKKLKSWNLSGCDLYVTMNPCDMCKSIIYEARIDNVYYYFENLKEKKYKTKILKINYKDEKKFIKLLNDFFTKKRCK